MATSERARLRLRTIRTVIVDEIHAPARDRRGSHLSLTLDRLDHAVRSERGEAFQRVGLSATQRPIEEIAAFLAGSERPCEELELGHQRALARKKGAWGRGGGEQS